MRSLVALSMGLLSCSGFAASQQPKHISCNANNCLRQLQDQRYSSMASAFCATHTTSMNAAPSAIPSYLGNCHGSPSAVSSACSCLVTMTTSFSGTVSRSSTMSTSTIRPTSSISSVESLSKPSTTSSTSTIPSTTITSTPSAPTPTPTFFLFANAPVSTSSVNGYYAQVVSGSIAFTATFEGSACGFTMDSAGHLIYNGLYAQIASTNVSQVQFVNSVVSLTKRQSAPNALICSVIADTTGASTLSCSANDATVPQACGTSFYLGSTNECQPLAIGYIAQGAPTTSVPPITPISGQPSSAFEIQYTGNNLFALYGAGTAPGTISIYFEHYSNGPTWTLDAQGHLLSTGPSQGGGAAVPYVATFAIGSALGLVLETTGVVPDGYVPIVCALTADAVSERTTLGCVDGTSGLNSVLQGCGNGHATLSLGSVVGAGCTALPFVAVFAAS